MEEFPHWEDVDSIKLISKKGRRGMDQRKLDAQMLEEDEKASGLYCTRLMPQLAKAMSENITLTNDISYVSDPFLIEWHERMP